MPFCANALTRALAVEGILATMTPLVLSFRPKACERLTKSTMLNHMACVASSLVPAVSIAVSSTYTSGAAKGCCMHMLCIPVRKSTLLKATECLHPDKIEVLVIMGLLQKPPHWMILGAVCCNMVIRRSMIGKPTSRALLRSTGMLMESKNLSKS